VEAVKGRAIQLSIAHDLSLRDGLGYFPAREASRDLAIFSVQRILRAGKDVKFARAGERVTVEVPAQLEGSMLRKGTEVRHLSSRFLDLPQPKEAGFPLYKIPVDVEIALSRQEGACWFSARFESSSAGLSGSFTRAFTLEKAARKRDFLQILTGLFKESATSPFIAFHLSLSNHTGLGDDELFVPPSELKGLKNELYRVVEELFKERIASASAGLAAPQSAATATLPQGLADRLCRRELLTPPGGEPVPYAWLSESAGHPSLLEEPAQLEGILFVPLPPVLGDERSWLEAIAGLSNERPRTRIAVGLNNVAHLTLAIQLSALANIEFFVDFHLYAANRLAVSTIQEFVPRLLFAYSWIEGDQENHEALASRLAGAVPMIRISPSFSAPLFYSLGCFARHAMNKGACLDGCPRDFRTLLRQGRSRFELVVRDCVTYLFRLDHAARSGYSSSECRVPSPPGP
jgi:hypothetical protein